MNARNITMPIMAALSFVLCTTSCSAEDNTDEKISSNLIEEINVSNFPVIDGSDSTTPLRYILMCKALGFDYIWENSYFSFDGVPKHITPSYTCTYEEQRHIHWECMKESNTHQSFMNLIDGTVELILTARSISRDEKEHADNSNVTLIEKPIAIDALAFMVHPSNTVDNLSTEQIQNIYMGKIKNWSEVGGSDMTLTAYIRNRNSGSQEKFETMVMAGLTIADLPGMQIGTTMDQPYYQLEADVTGLAFTPFYYYSVMVGNGKTKAIGIDGVAMTKENIKNGKYPYVTEVYAAVRSDIDKGSVAYKLFEYLTTSAGQAIVEESGYVPLSNSSGIRSVRADAKRSMVYSIDGKPVGTNLKGLGKGIYIQNGEKSDFEK